MKRRDLLATLAAAPLLASLPSAVAAAPGSSRLARRVRPSDPEWPSAAQWDSLRRDTGGRLIDVQSPLADCHGDACADVFKELKNPYYIGDNVGLTQTTGWADAWTYRPSVYAVTAETASDVAAAVNFAREHNLRLVVKGGGHSYLGRSNAPDSLLVWTRRMDAVVLHDAFIGEGCGGQVSPQPAVSVGSGAIWGRVYHAVTTKTGRYVQGGGCLTVGVAGLVQAGGFGSFSKQFGTAAANLLEAEVVTADGAVRIANACTNSDLFWALKGGGGGSLGIVTRLTLQTHELPPTVGGVRAIIVANSVEAFRRLVEQFVSFYAAKLLNPHWGEIVTLRPGNRMDVRMSFLGLDRRQAEDIWQSFFDWVEARMPDDYAYREAPSIRSGPARHLWDPAFLKAIIPGGVLTDDRPGASADNIFWAGNMAEAGHFIFAYQSLWLPAALLEQDRRAALADAVCDASRHAPVELHFQKGLAGGSTDAVSATRDTAMNPKVFDAFALAIVGGEGPPAYPGLAGHEPDLGVARKIAAEVGKAMAIIEELAPDGGCYFAESDFFEPRWQEAYWGPNYQRLLSAKQKYDPDGLFFVHHGVGSEEWSADGFERLATKR
jgi:FAD/FMN-containing dehydrogenase